MMWLLRFVLIGGIWLSMPPEIIDWGSWRFWALFLLIPIYGTACWATGMMEKAACNPATS